MKTIDDVRFLDLQCFSELNGNLIPIEFDKNIPFDVKRIFYIFGVLDRQARGKHSHFKTEQILICLNGTCEVFCADGITSKKYILDSPKKALYIPEMIWDEQVYTTEDTVLVVLSNTFYDKRDYIEDWEEFLICRKNY